jgi:hypothetical protein
VDGWRKSSRAWDLCAACRIHVATRLCYDRRLAFSHDAPSGGPGSGQDRRMNGGALRVYTSAATCRATPVPNGVVSCFCDETGTMNRERCNASEASECPRFALTYT